MNTTTSTWNTPRWFWVTATLGLLWNIFGVIQFLSTVGGTRESLMRGGMTSPQAELYIQLPLWMTVSFAVGVFGGVMGSILLLLRKRTAVPVFWGSLAAYSVLYAGDVTQGIFAAFGTPQVIILTTVVLIAMALLWLALRCRKLGGLR